MEYLENSIIWCEVIEATVLDFLRTYPILIVVRVGDGLLGPVVLGGLVGSGGLILVGRHLGALSLTIMTDYVLSPLLREEISVEFILDSSALSNFFFFC